MTNIPLGRPRASNFGGYDGKLPAAPPRTLKRSMGLTIDRQSEESGSACITVNGSDYFPPQYEWEFERYRRESKVREYCQFVRESWTKEVVKCHAPYTFRYVADGEHFAFRRNGFPFLDAWDHGPELLQQKIGPSLALAGQNLFRQLFRNTSQHDNRHEPPDNKEIRLRFLEQFERALAEGEQVITIHANCFFVPWGMLYTHPSGDPLKPDGSNFAKEGFWGYRHIIEHCPFSTYGLERVIRPSLEDGRVATGFHVDDSITLVDDHDVVTRQRDFFACHPLVASSERTLKQQLGAALQGNEFHDRLMYFFCHGQGAGEVAKPNLGSSWLKLSDPPGTYITVNDFDRWLADREFESAPFVFCNACQGGQMTTNFYESIALKILEHGAAGLIGPQIDMPIVFADEFGRRFFTQFLGDGIGQAPAGSAGTILRELTRAFIDEHHNPLGLAYSLYGGADMQFVTGAQQLDEGAEN